MVQERSNRSSPYSSVSKTYVVIIMQSITIMQGWKFEKSACLCGTRRRVKGKLSSSMVGSQQIMPK